jgi:TonB family protein
VHATLILGVGRSLPRVMGEPDGSKDAITVDLVDAATLAAMSPAPVQPTAAPAAQRDTGERPAAPADTPAPPERAQPRQKAPEWPMEKEALSLASPPSASEKREEGAASSQRKAAPHRQPGLALQLDMPDMPMAPSGRYAAVARPPGVTRSGENDEFGRRVIQALRKTMPAHRGIFGRATVRLVLTDTGNLAEVQLVRSGGDPVLDQDVVFAVKQSSFPIPPAAATIADRTFLVTYIYS